MTVPSQTVVGPTGPLLSLPLRSAKRYGPRPITGTRWFVTGFKSGGKSHLGASIEGAIIMDFEGKMEFIHDEHFKALDAVQPTTLEEVDQMVDWIIAERKKPDCPIKMVVWDAADEFLHGILIPGLTDVVRKQGTKLTDTQTVCDYGSGGGGSKGWDMVTTRALSYLRRLYLAGCGWMVLGHIKEERVVKDGASITALRPAINPGYFGGIYRMTEFVCKTGLRHTVTKVPTKGRHPLTGKEMTTMKEVPTTVGVMAVREKVGDTASHHGGNVTLPAEIELPLGSAWATITDQYERAVGRGPEGTSDG